MVDHADRIHARLAELVLADRPRSVVDLGAARGRTLAQVARLAPEVQLVAVDIDDEALAAARAALPSARIVRHDLAEPLPFAQGSVDALISHNTLEAVRDPSGLIRQIAFALRPGGRAVLGHTDFETIVVATDDRELNRRVLLTYAELPVPYEHYAAADPHMGRLLPGLASRSLRVDSVEAHTVVITDLDDALAARLKEVAAVARRCAARGMGYVSLDDVQAWVDQLHSMADRSEFLFSETAYLVTAHAPFDMEG